MLVFYFLMGMDYRFGYHLIMFTVFFAISQLPKRDTKQDNATVTNDNNGLGGNKDDVSVTVGLETCKNSIEQRISWNERSEVIVDSKSPEKSREMSSTLSETVPNGPGDLNELPEDFENTGSGGWFESIKRVLKDTFSDALFFIFLWNRH